MSALLHRVVRVAVWSVCCLSPCISAQDGEDLRNAVVLINAGPQRGSGIVVDVRGNSVWIVTARHVVVEDNEWRSRIMVNFYGAPFASCPAVGRAFARGDDEDLALLEVPRCEGVDLPRFPVLTIRGNPREGESVSAIGHDGDNSFKRTAAKPVSGEVTVQTDGASLLNFRFDAQGVAGGFSGGPVVTEDGELVGMTVLQDGDSAAALKIESIVDLLRSRFQYPQWSQLRVESSRPSDRQELTHRLAMLRGEAEPVLAFFEKRKQERTRLGGTLRTEILASMSALTSSLDAAGSALKSGQITAARRYLEAAHRALESLKALQ